VVTWGVGAGSIVDTAVAGAAAISGGVGFSSAAFEQPIKATKLNKSR
jgi:hypothetical protein